MNTPAFENLDLACARAGHLIAMSVTEKKGKELEKLVTDALAVLQEQGVYAMALFLETSKNKGRLVQKTLQDFLKKRNLLHNHGSFPDAVQNDLATNLDKLLLARELLTQVLVYARYHAKALEGVQEAT